MPIRPRAGRRLPARQRKSWSSSSALGALNACTSQPCGIDRVHDVLDDAVFARRIHALQHDEHGVPVAARRARPAVCRSAPAPESSSVLPPSLSSEAPPLSLVSTGDSRNLSPCSIRKRLAMLVRSMTSLLHAVRSNLAMTGIDAQRCRRKAGHERQHDGRVHIGGTRPIAHRLARVRSRVRDAPPYVGARRRASACAQHLIRAISTPALPPWSSPARR